MEASRLSPWHFLHLFTSSALSRLVSKSRGTCAKKYGQSKHIGLLILLIILQIIAKYQSFVLHCFTWAYQEIPCFHRSCVMLYYSLLFSEDLEARE